jgi:hypothetical protein
MPDPIYSHDRQTEGVLKLHRIPLHGEVSKVSKRPKTPLFSSLSGLGEEVDHRCPIIGGPAVFARTSPDRGGAHNHASRESHSLTTRQVAGLIAATRHSTAIGLPFTRMITIHWQSAGIALDGMAKATGRFIDLLSKALARHGSKTAWLWVHENGPKKGWHCHLLVHVPAALVRIVTRLQKKWLKAITGQIYRRRVIKSDPIGRRLRLEQSNPELHAANLATVLSYVVKGANSEAAEAFALERQEAGGRIIGKRCGWSQNIGEKARTSSICPVPKNPSANQ